MKLNVGRFRIDKTTVFPPYTVHNTMETHPHPEVVMGIKEDLTNS